MRTLLYGADLNQCTPLCTLSPLPSLFPLTGLFLQIALCVVIYVVSANKGGDLILCEMISSMCYTSAVRSQLFIWILAQSLLNILGCACFQEDRPASGRALCHLKAPDQRPSEGLLKTLQIYYWLSSCNWMWWWPQIYCIANSFSTRV